MFYLHSNYLSKYTLLFYFKLATIELNLCLLASYFVILLLYYDIKNDFYMIIVFHSCFLERKSTTINYSNLMRIEILNRFMGLFISI